MSQEELLVYVRRASPSQVRIAAVAAFALFVAFAVSLPYARVELPKIHSFIPVVDTVLMFGDSVTAILLFTQASILRSRPLVALASGYLFGALIIIPHALTFPGAFTETGLLNAGVNTTIWIYIFWHCGLPTAVIAYAMMQRGERTAFEFDTPMRPIIRRCIAGIVVLFAMLTILATAGHDLLPPLMSDSVNWSSGRLLYIALVLLALLVVAMACVWPRHRFLLNLWLLVALWAWTLELLLVISTSARFSLGWYVGRFAGMLSGVFVLLALLIETSRLYTQLSVAVVARDRQREGRLMSMDAVAASIAHQIKQPMTAMITNAGAALVHLERPEPEMDRVRRILRAVVDDGHRAADAIGGIRAMFGSTSGPRSRIDMHDLIRRTLSLLTVELNSRHIAVELHLKAQPHIIAANRVQLQQVLLNLMTNAIEAMTGDTSDPKVLSISSAASDGGQLFVTIRDTGGGIPEENAGRIFGAFFTTKPFGTGMGLPVCRSIVEAHGGRLSMTANEPRGTSFIVQLPYREL